MGGVGNLRQQSAETTVHGDVRVPAHLAPIGVVCPCGHTAILIGEIHHAAKAVGVDVGHIDAFLDALPPPVAAFANRHDLQLVQTVGVEEVIAVLLGLHQHPLVDVQSGIVNDIIRLDHFRLFDAGLHAGRLAVEVRVAVAVVLKDLLRADPHAETVEGVCADLTGLVGAPHHAVCLVIEIGRSGDILGAGGGRRTNLFFLHQIAALIVGIAVVVDAGELLLVAAHMLAHHLVEVVVLVGILFALSWTALLQQVAQLHRLDVYIFIMLLSSPPLTSTYRIKSLYIFLRNQ